MPSATGAMPSLSTVAMRWFQEASVPILCAVSQKDQRPHPLGARGGEVLGDQSADGEAAENDLADAEVVEQPGEVRRVVGDRIGRGPDVGQAVTALVVAQERDGLGQIVGHGVPNAEVGAQRVDEDQRRPAVPARQMRVMERGSVDGGELQKSVSPVAPPSLLDFGAR